jgi:ribosomal-protein-alanine N-acetyltransferase
MISVEEATSKDTETIFSLSAARILDSKTTLEEIKYFINNPDFLVLVLKKETQVIGYLSFRIEGKEAEIDELAIATDEENKGYGTMLLSSGLSLLKSKQFTTVYLDVRENNLKAISLYEKLGFIKYRSRKNYYVTVSAYCYKKELNDER